MYVCIYICMFVYIGGSNDGDDMLLGNDRLRPGATPTTEVS